MAVKAWLEGDQFDLEELAALLPTGAVRVVKEDARYYLTSPEIDNPPAGKQFYETAPVVLIRINGLGRAHNPSFQPVRLTNTYQEGDRQHVVAFANSIAARGNAHGAGVVMTGDGTPIPPPPPAGPRHVAVQDANIAEALDIMGKPRPLGWVELYKVYEIVRAAGALPTVQDAAGFTDTELDLFKHTANHPVASGRHGRHARSRSRPPKSPMQIEEARELLSRLVRAWLDAAASP